jgi:hypothetical protein
MQEGFKSKTDYNERQCTLWYDLGLFYKQSFVTDQINLIKTWPTTQGPELNKLTAKDLKSKIHLLPRQDANRNTT